MTRSFSRIILALIISIVIWLVLMILVAGKIDPEWGDLVFLLWIKDPGLKYYLGYLIGIVFTILTIMFFGGLYAFLRRKTHSLTLWIAILFVPIYGVINLLVYSSQLLFVPQLIQSYSDQIADVRISMYLLQMIQLRAGSFMAYSSSLAYLILGIPSVIFGILLLKSHYTAKFAGSFLILYAVSCLLGVTGSALGNKFLSMGTMDGVVFFLIAMIFLFAYTRLKGQAKHDLPD